MQILSISDGERITSVIPVSEFAGDQFLLMLTMNGYVKKVSLNSFSSIRSTGIIAIQLVCPLLLFLVSFFFSFFFFFFWLVQQ
jgi:DNA gyrase subunit A